MFGEPGNVRTACRGPRCRHPDLRLFRKSARLAIEAGFERILFGGCMVKSSESVGYLGDASLACWPTALERLGALDPRWVVPGHGRRFDPGILSLTEPVVREAAAAGSD